MDGKNLRIVFMGTPDFAVASLKALVESGYNVVGVVTAPDKPAGRGKKIGESAVKIYAIENNIAILQPEKLKEASFLEVLKNWKADLQVIVAFRMLPEAVWKMPRLGTFNLHGSLLPQYRGAAPINWAVINGEPKTGVTTFLLDHEIDTGNILFKREIEIGENETVGEIHDKLMVIGAKLVTETVDAIAKGNIKPVPQDGLLEKREIKHAPKIFKEDCKIDWTKDAESVRNLVRGLSPHPSAWTNLVHLESGIIIPVKIFFVEKVSLNTTLKQGEINSDGKNFVNVGCGMGCVSITELQVAGKKRMKAADFLRGFQGINDYKMQ